MKGEVQQVFVFIMLVLVAAVVLLLGYRFIGTLFITQCDVEDLELRDMVQDHVDAYSKYGTVKSATLPAACGATQLCVIDARAFGEPVDGIYPGDSDFSYPELPTIQAYLRVPSTPPNNVFVNGDDGLQSIQLWLPKLILNDTVTPVHCFNATSGYFRVRYTGQGLHVVMEAQ